jgi:hypothetical protein
MNQCSESGGKRSIFAGMVAAVVYGGCGKRLLMF